MVYERNGYEYEMLVIADKVEADFIAESLGLREPTEIVSIISIKERLN